MDGLLGFVLTSLALAGSPGPATLSLAATAAAFGPRRGLAYMAGIVVGMVAVMALTAAGVIGALLAVPGATPFVAGSVAVYFGYLAVRIATAPPLRENDRPRRQPSFMGGLFLSLVNPKGYAAMSALLAGFALIRNRPGLDIAVKIALLTAIITAVSAAWLAAGGALTRCFRDPRTNRAINIVLAAILLASTAAALWP
jgi:threonine/homoserine/homoserine lactone efflux protein